MAKKKPNKNASTEAAKKETPVAVNETETQEEQTIVTTDRAAVNVDDNGSTPKKAKKSASKSNEKKPNIFKRMWKGIKGIFSELKKVTWPKGKSVGSNTAVVLVVVVLFFVVLFVIDYVLTGLLGLTTSGEWTHLWN